MVIMKKIVTISALLITAALTTAAVSRSIESPKTASKQETKTNNDKPTEKSGHLEENDSRW